MINKQFEDSEKFFSIFRESKIDCLVMPGFAVPPVKHGHSRYLLYGAVYTFLLNVLDLPSSAIPVTLVRKDEEE